MAGEALQMQAGAVRDAEARVGDLADVGPAQATRWSRERFPGDRRVGIEHA
jgi:hypothetical protein